MPFFIDQINHKVELNTRRERIVCLVPSITELLFDIGLVDSIVGITKFCIHPAEAKQRFFFRHDFLSNDSLFNREQLRGHF